VKEFFLTVKELSKNYGKIAALKKASFSIKRSVITSFLGANGAGKATTIKLILGFLKRNSGIIELEEGRVRYVPEYPLFFSWLKGKEIISYTLRLYGITENSGNSLIEKYSEKIGFDTQLLSRKIQTYSLGNQKKFSYLQSLIISPEFLIADEPFYSLDPFSIKKVRDLFLELKKTGTTFFLSSHIISEIEKFADEFIIIKKGEIIIQNNLNDFKNNYILIRIEKAGTEKRNLLAFTSFIKEQDSHFEIILNRNQLKSFEAFCKGKETSIYKSEVDLENIFIFFA
jgi:ABC-2 type transport system ATP-binding protein